MSTGAIHVLDNWRPDIDASAWIAPGAQVIGKVRLAAGASVWFNAVLRGDNELISIGARSNIQDGCVLHTDPGCPLSIGEDVTIGHNAVVHGCVVEDGALIGMGATVLNGARIGAGALVGANALVTEGMEFPPGSLIVGAPARAVKTLDDETIAELRATAARYVANAARFANGLRSDAEGAPA
ncbi:MAG: gamma carbonic anhydrase family protein [Pseudomonadota bacterium]